MKKYYLLGLNFLFFLYACGNGQQALIPPVSTILPTPVPSILDIKWHAVEWPIHGSGFAQTLYRGNIFLFGGRRSQLGTGFDGSQIILNGVDIYDVGEFRAYTKGFRQGNVFTIVSGRQNNMAQQNIFSFNLKTIIDAQGQPLMNLPITFNTSMQTERLSFALAVDPNGRIFIAGGYKPDAMYTFPNSVTTLASVEMYDPIMAAWQYVPDMPEGAMTHLEGFIYKDAFYIVGGFFPPGLDDSERIYAEKIWRLPFATMQWEAVMDMPDKRSGQSICLVGNNLIIAGGTNIYMGGTMPVNPRDNFYDAVWVIDLDNLSMAKMPSKIGFPVNDVQCDQDGERIYLALGEEPSNPATLNKSNKLQIGTLEYVQ